MTLHIFDLIAFTPREEFRSFPAAGHLTLTLVSHGKATLIINGKKVALSPPCLLLSSTHDKVEFCGGDKPAAKSFHFHPTFVNKSLTFERLADSDFREISDKHDNSLLNLFLTRHKFNNGMIHLLPQPFLRFSELFDLIAKETEMREGGRSLASFPFAPDARIKSGEPGLFRVRRYLIQILFLLQDEYACQTGSDALSGESVTDIVLDYIHGHYAEKITIETLCGLVYVNRTTLTRKFKARAGRAPIDYLLHYRLSVACELLTYSKLSISKIAESSGFLYETYFIRQFKAKIGITPAEYRQSEGFETLNMNESRILEEI